MPTVTFAPAIQRHVAQSATEVGGATVREALEEVFRNNPPLRGYVLDDQGDLRPHVAVFVDGRSVADPRRLSDKAPAEARIDVIQALSGG